MNPTIPIQQSLLYEETAEVDFTADSVDLERLRYQFAPLFDRAAHAVQRAGYEQDDAVINRFFLCRLGTEGPYRVSAESLTDRDRFLKHLLNTAYALTNERLTPSAVRVVGLGVEAVLEQWQ